MVEEHRKHEEHHEEHHEHHGKAKHHGFMWVLLVVVIILLVIVQVQISSLNKTLKDYGIVTGKINVNTPSGQAAPAGAPRIDFYVMAYCPYGNQAEEGIAPVYKQLAGKANFNPHYVIYSNYQGGGAKYCIDPASKYCSMHGAQEMNEDVREMCVNKYMGVGKWFDFALAMNSKCTAQNADTCWEAVASGVGLDTAKIKTCAANEGLTLAEAELQLDATNKVSGSPTIFINGNAYNGGRAAADFLSALCAAFTVKPAECANAVASTPAAAAGNCA